MEILNDKTIYGTVEKFIANYRTDFLTQKKEGFQNLLSYLQDRKQKYDEIWEITQLDIELLLTERHRSNEWEEKYRQLSVVRENNIKINHYLEFEIAKQSAIIDNGQQPIEPIEIPPLTKFQKQTIQLLIESGVIELLRNKYNANDNQIGVFIDEVTKKRIRRGTANNYVTKDHKDYAIQNSIDIQDTKKRLKTIFKDSLL